MKAWLQSADLSVREFEADESSAIPALEHHDWNSEELLQRKPQSNGLASCPAGLGLVLHDGRILHICPNGNSALVHFHRPTRLLSFVWPSQRILSQPDMPARRLPELVHHFFNQRDIALESLV